MLIATIAGWRDGWRKRRKRRLLAWYGRRYGCDTFVETGTYRGDTVAALRQRFDALWSIELDPGLAQAAARRFANAGNVMILCGDSAELVPLLAAGMNRRRVLWWLDAHYSGGITAGGDSPLCAELAALRERAGAGVVILIDDARLFGRDPAFPELGSVRQWADENGMRCAVGGDVIRLTPGRGVSLGCRIAEAAACCLGMAIAGVAWLVVAPIILVRRGRKGGGA
jgi:hypothetical protein